MTLEFDNARDKIWALEGYLLLLKQKKNYFQKKSTYTQIELYSHLVGDNEAINRILILLKG